MNSQQKMTTDYFLREPVTDLLVHMIQQVPNMNENQLTQLNIKLQEIVREGLWG